MDVISRLEERAALARPPSPARREVARWRYWLPWRRDPILSAERQGRWRWHWALAFTLLLAVLFLAAIFLLQGLVVLAGSLAGRPFDLNSASLDDQSFFTPGNMNSFVSLFLAYIALLIATMMALHLRRRERGWGFSYGVAVSWKPFWKAGGAMALLLSVGTAVQVAMFPSSFSLGPVSAAGNDYLLWFGLAAVVLLVQTLAEELTFRGFLLRVWGAVLPYRLPVVLAISGIFIALHAENPDVQADLWFSIIAFVVIEIVYYWALFRTRNVMATWGMHWVNNVYAFLLVAQQPGWKNDIALFTYNDPVLGQGGSYLLNPFAYLLLLGFAAAFMALIAWKRSLFYIAVEPLPAVPDERESFVAHNDNVPAAPMTSEADRSQPH